MRSDPQSSNWIVLVVLFGLVLTSSRGCLSPGPGPDQTKPAQVCLLIVEEATSRTVEQGAIFASAELRQWLSTRGHLLRIVDQDATDATGQPARVLGPWRALPALPGGQSRVLPWALLVLADGSVYRDGPLPGSSAGVVEWVKANTAAE